MARVPEMSLCFDNNIIPKIRETNVYKLVDHMQPDLNSGLRGRAEPRTTIS